MSRIAYKSGYKYQLVEEYSSKIPLKPCQNIDHEWVTLTTDGVITIKNGYAWDGPSGPTFDTNDFMRGSLIHDALYQLMREGLLPQEYRAEADQVLYNICREDGMSQFIAEVAYLAVRAAASPCANPDNVKVVRYAP